MTAMEMGGPRVLHGTRGLSRRAGDGSAAMVRGPSRRVAGIDGCPPRKKERHFVTVKVVHLPAAQSVQ